MKNLLFLFFTISLTNTSLLAQLQKGDIMLGFDSEASIGSNDYSSDQFVALSFDIGKMISNRSLIGLDFNASRSWFQSDVIDFEYNAKSYTINFTPYYRYYFKPKGKYLPFAQILTTIGHAEEQVNDYAVDSRGLAFKANLEIGANYFITPNIALEIVVGTKLFEEGDLNLDKLNEERFYLNIGFKTFLRESTSDQENLLNRYLKRGNYNIGGSAYFHSTSANSISLISEREYFQLGETSGVTMGVAPEINYFFTDRWTLGGGFNLGFLKTGTGHRLQTGLNASTAYYLRLSDKLYLLPELGIGYNQILVDADILEFNALGTPPNIIRNKVTLHEVNIPASLSLNYFTKKSILSAGINYNRTRYSYKDSDFSSTTEQMAAFIGVEHFFAPYLSAEVRWNYEMDTTKFEETSNLVEKANLSFGLNYFIFK